MLIIASTKPEGSLSMHIKILRLGLDMVHLYSFHISTLYSPYIHSNITIPSTPTSQILSFLQVFHHILYRLPFTFLPCVCYISKPSHSS
jgi:hypothetical protein